MKLSKRLEKIVEITPSAPCVADIGTDHGYVACGLLLEGRIQRAIASDINRKPLEKAMATARRLGLSDRVDFRLGSGLTILESREAQGVIIAGMGGELTRQILETAADLVRELDFMVLQPAQNPEVLRQYFYGGGFAILHEDLVREEDGRFYEYFVVRSTPGSPVISDRALEHIASPKLMGDRHPLMADFLRARIIEIQSIQAKLDLAYESSRQKHEDLEKRKTYFEEGIKWLSD